MDWEIFWQFSIMVVVCYFLGNINIARFFSKLRKDDITKKGSGNPGTMNVLRSYGFGLGALTFIFDIVKCAGPVLAVYFMFKDKSPYSDLNNVLKILDYGIIAMFITALSVIIGHIYPVLWNFNGGKGVASTLGAFFIITSVLGYWYVGLAIFGAGFLYILLFEWGSVGSLIMTTAFPVFTITYFVITYDMTAWLAFIICANILVCFLSYWKHRTNLTKLKEGRENRTKLLKMILRKYKDHKEQKNSEEKLEIKTEAENSETKDI